MIKVTRISEKNSLVVGIISEYGHIVTRRRLPIRIWAVSIVSQWCQIRRVGKNLETVVWGVAARYWSKLEEVRIW
jgi:hypothetical protein